MMSFPHFRIRHIQLVIDPQPLYCHSGFSELFHVVLCTLQGPTNSRLINTEPSSNGGLIQAITPQKQDLPLAASDRGNTSAKHIAHRRLKFLIPTAWAFF